LADSHSEGAVDEEGMAAGFVDEEEQYARGGEEECLLDAGGDEVEVPVRPAILKT
jgi:hypothetical protein